MQFSRKIDYGLIFLEVLKPTYRSGAYMSLHTVAERQRLPLPFLEKIAAVLRQAGMVSAKKGSEGGYRLILDPKTITLQRVIRLFEEPPMMKCMRSPHPEKFCPLVPHCPTRRKWLEVERQVNSIFERVTVAEL